MKLSNSNAIRAALIKSLMEQFNAAGEDVGQIASNIFNFPVVAEDGEEGWVEIAVKVPKGTKDEEYDGYGRREQYSLDCEEKAAKKAEKEKAAAEKRRRLRLRRPRRPRPRKPKRKPGSNPRPFLKILFRRTTSNLYD